MRQSFSPSDKTLIGDGDSTPQSPALALQTAQTLHPDRLDQRVLLEFSQRSVSDETRRAYRRVVREFFRFTGNRHPAEIIPADVQRWRDQLIKDRKSASTVTFKLSVIRSLFDYLKITDIVTTNPALAKLVPPPKLSEDLRGRALTSKEVRYVLAGPDRSKRDGARDYALLLMMLRTSLRVAEACSLKASSIRWSHGRWTLRFKVKGGRERTIPLPRDVKEAIDEYLKLDRSRRSMLGSGGDDAYIFQPHTNYRTLVFNKAISTTMAWHIVRRWGEYSGVGKLSPHDLRRTAITKALDQGLTYRQVQMMSGHKDPKTVMRYDHHRENLDQNAVNFLEYDEN
jgi:integrase/recombinase XerD